MKPGLAKSISLALSAMQRLRSGRHTFGSSVTMKPHSFTVMTSVSQTMMPSMSRSIHSRQTY